MLKLLISSHCTPSQFALTAWLTVPSSFNIPTSFAEILILHDFRLNQLRFNVEEIRCNGDQCCVREFFVMCAASRDIWQYTRSVVTRLSCDLAIRASLRKKTRSFCFIFSETKRFFGGVCKTRNSPEHR